jgi:hypothetical protein
MKESIVKIFLEKVFPKPPLPCPSRYERFIGLLWEFSTNEPEWLHHTPRRKNYCLLIRRRQTPAARRPVPTPPGAFRVGTCVGGVVCTGSGVVVAGMEVTAKGRKVVGGMAVIRTGSGVV